MCFMRQARERLRAISVLISYAETDVGECHEPGSYISPCSVIEHRQIEFSSVPPKTNIQAESKPRALHQICSN